MTMQPTSQETTHPVGYYRSSQYHPCPGWSTVSLLYHQDVARWLIKLQHLQG